MIWMDKNKHKTYLDLDKKAGAGKFFIQLLTYWVAYSHMIPISLYVVIEMTKLG